MQARALAAINSNKIRIAAVALVEVPVQVAVQAAVVHHTASKEIGKRRISVSSRVEASAILGRWRTDRLTAGLAPVFLATPRCLPRGPLP
jgi:hypothetical protein